MVYQKQHAVHIVKYILGYTRFCVSADFRSYLTQDARVILKQSQSQIRIEIKITISKM